MSIYSFQFFLLVKQEQALHNGWSDLKTDSCLNGCDRAVSVDVLCVHQRGEASALYVCVCEKNDDVSVKWFDSKEYKKEERRKKIIIIIIIIKHTLLF